MIEVKKREDVENEELEAKVDEIGEILNGIDILTGLGIGMTTLAAIFDQLPIEAKKYALEDLHNFVKKLSESTEE